LAQSNLTVRVLTAVVAVPLLLGLLFYGEALWFYGLVAAACFIGASELFAMTHAGDRVAQAFGIAMTMGASVGLYFYGDDSRVFLAILLGTAIVGVLLPLWRLGDIETSALRLLANVAGPIYIGLLLTTIGLLRRDRGDEGAEYVVMTLTFAWFADTGGYFAGRFLGKNKLYEKVSPKKTREGYYGSIAGATLGGLVAHFLYLKSIPLPHALALGFICGAIGQLGDLVESLLKRSTGVKDSGWIIPGHGGLLDRIDALLIVSPIVYLYTAFFASPR
jgi:phosphatidate cytidylyltransferase